LNRRSDPGNALSAALGGAGRKKDPISMPIPFLFRPCFLDFPVQSLRGMFIIVYPSLSSIYIASSLRFSVSPSLSDCLLSGVR
jgi:hypothetical protein